MILATIRESDPIPLVLPSPKERWELEGGGIWRPPPLTGSGEGAVLGVLQLEYKDFVKDLQSRSWRTQTPPATEWTRNFFLHG